MNVRKLTQKPVWILLLLLSISVNAQNSLWQQVAVTETQSFDLEERNSTPTTFDVYKLDTQNFKEIIQQAPERFRSISSLIFPYQSETDNYKISVFMKHRYLKPVFKQNIRIFAPMSDKELTILLQLHALAFLLSASIS